MTTELKEIPPILTPEQSQKQKFILSYCKAKKINAIALIRQRRFYLDCSLGEAYDSLFEELQNPNRVIQL